MKRMSSQKREEFPWSDLGTVEYTEETTQTINLLMFELVCVLNVISIDRKGLACLNVFELDLC